MSASSDNCPLILIVKDDQQVLSLLVELLEAEGYKVIAADSARRALEFTSTFLADLIISDVVMPEMNGLELCHRLKTNPKTASIPVMMVSALRKEDAALIEGYSAGADDYLEIPFRNEELLIKVARLIERHRAQKALQKSAKEYRLLFKANPCPMWLCDQRTLQFLAVNDAAVKHYGYTPKEFLAMTAKDIRPEEDVPDLIEHVTTTKTAGAEAGVWRHRKKDGTLIDVDVSWHKVEFSGRNAYFVLANDVTAKKRSETALIESEQRYREIFDNANDIIYTHDLEGKFTSLNHTGEKLTGYSIAEAMSMNFSQVVVADQVELARGMLERKLANEDVATVYELDIVSKQRRRITLELSTRLIYRDGKPVGVQGIGRDVTERKRAEAELVRRNQELAALNEISHELSKLGEPAEIANLIHSMIGNVIDNRNLYVALYDEQKGEVSFPAYTINGQPYNSPTRKLGLGLTEHVIRTKRPLYIERDLDAALEKLGLKLSGRSAQCWLAVPMMVGEKVVGVITTQDYEQPAAYDDGHLELMRTIAAHAAIVIQNARLYGEMKQHADRVALSNRISQAIRCTLDVSEVLATAVRELGTHLNVDRCSLFMKDESASRVTNVAEYHRPEVGPAAHDLDVSQVNRLHAAMEECGVLAFDNAAADERIRDLYEGMLKHFRVKSIMYIGVTVGDELLGAFALSTTTSTRKWSETDIEVAKSVADHTGIAIRQARLYQKAEATSVREALVNKLGGAIRSSLSIPEILETTVRELGVALNASRVQVRLCDGSNDELFVKTQYAIDGQEANSEFDGYYDQLLREHFRDSSQPLVIPNVPEFANQPSQLASGISFYGKEQALQATLVSPLTVNSRFRGVICIEQTSSPRHWTADEVMLVESVGAQLASGIAQAELFQIVARAKNEWETTFDAMSDGVLIFDPNGILIRVNQAAAAMDNESPQTILGRKCCEILRADSDELECVVERSLREAESVNLEIVPHKLKRPVLVTVEPVFDSAHQVVGAVCTARDLSELRKVEAVARERQSLLKNILESAREAIYAVDRDGMYQWCNQAMLDLTGFEMRELIGRYFLENVHDDDRDMRRARFAASVNGEPQRFESRYVSRDGAIRYALVNTAPIIVDGETTGVLGIAHDITEQKQERERAARADKLRALGQLASGVAHDFNNSLAAILGRAQLVLRRVHDEELIRSLGVIVTAAEDAASTVRRIQTFARKSSAAEMELLDIGSLLRDAIEITRTRWQNEAQAAGRLIDVVVNADAGMLTRGNASELREVFVNLIVNSVDAMPDGGALKICCQGDGDRLRLRFADTGTGMEEDVRERIFEPFYTTKGMNGTGLGLAVSYGIIERHDGTISVSSKVGEGTTFHIELPFADTSEQAPSASEATVNARPSLSVLVVDDEQVVRETLAEMLADLDHKVVTAESGRDAVQKIGSDEFDLVFTDLAMPEMDGWETAREIRRQKPELPVVLVTGYGATAQPPSGEVDLVAGIIGKPFDFDQVTGTIARVVAP
ncbi:MAG TPA: PAS domain S-box protein [Pyrinomonadaceae bacterium]|nr:PAS domain S-box protein [Pyrinomonadaceae bacterium]